MASLANDAQKTVSPTLIALTWFRQRYFRKQGEIREDEIAELVLKIALAHPKQIGQWMDEFISYRNAEGFNTEDAAVGLINARVVQQPEYKAIRRKLERGAR